MDQGMQTEIAHMALIVYADFDSPRCYLAARRADALTAAGIAVDWRAVQRRPARPATGTPVTAQEQDALAHGFDELDGILLAEETLPRVMPALRPNTEAAVSAYAEAYATVVTGEVRRLLFNLYWMLGLDIGSPTVLRTPLAGAMIRANAGADSMRQFGFAVSISRGPITTQAYRRINAWRDEWRRLDELALPVVLVDGTALTGADAVRRLGDEIVRRRANVNPPMQDPRRYPAVEGTPSLQWVSRVGGRWRHVYKLTVAS